MAIFFIRGQKIMIDGKMQIAGAPEGSKAEMKSNYGGNFDISYLGINP